MKNKLKLIFGAAVTIAFSISAQAEVLNCQGRDQDSKVTAVFLNLAQTELKEGVKQPMAVRIEETVKNAKGYEEQNVLFAGVIKTQSEDVQLFLLSKKVSGTIFMDETNDVNIKVNGRDISLDCQSEVKF